MNKRDSEKDSDRPHYYSQFWLDVAAGRRTIGGPRSEDEEQLDEIPEPIAPRRAARNGQDYSSSFDRQQERDDDAYEAAIETPTARSTVEPLAVSEEVGEPELEQEPEAVDFTPEDIGDLDLQEAAVEDADIPDMDFEPLEEEPEEEDFYDDEEEEEEEDDWGGGRGRKKSSKPSRPNKSNKPQRPRRDTRRGSY